MMTVLTHVEVTWRPSGVKRVFALIDYICLTEEVLADTTVRWLARREAIAFLAVAAADRAVAA